MAQNFMSLLSPLLATRATLGTGTGYKTQLALIATVGPNSHALNPPFNSLFIKPHRFGGGALSHSNTTNPVDIILVIGDAAGKASPRLRGTLKTVE